MISPAEERGFLELAASPHDADPARTHRLVSDAGIGEQLDEAQRRGSLTGRVQSYSRVMHSYTMLQMQSSYTFNTLPGYQKSMYEFTQSQMKRQRSASQARSETSSPHVMAQQAVLPSPVGSNIPHLSLDDAPPPPCNSPSPENSPPSVPQVVVKRGLKPRSTTEPIPREFAIGVKDRTGLACG